MSEDLTRTRQGALEVLLTLRRKVLTQLTDERAKTLFTENLVQDVFREAWRNSFEDDRTAFRQKIRQLVSDAIEEQKLKEAD